MTKKFYGYARVSTQKQSIERQERNINTMLHKLALEYYKDLIPEGTEKGFNEYYKNHTFVYKDKFTGTKMDRPEWNKLVKELQEGDTVVFDEVSRMSRNAEEGFKTYKDLYERGVNLVFLKEPAMNTANFRKTMQAQIPMTGNDVDIILEAVNKYIWKLAESQIYTCFEVAEHEVDFLHKRTSEGMKAKGATNTYKINDDGSRILEELGSIARSKIGKKVTTKKSIQAKEIILKHSKDFNGSLSDPECMKLAGLARNTFYKYKRELKEI